MKILNKIKQWFRKRKEEKEEQEYQENIESGRRARQNWEDLVNGKGDKKQTSVTIQLLEAGLEAKKKDNEESEEENET